jgi:ParB-like chromosome segregation protein Spo0J
MDAKSGKIKIWKDVVMFPLEKLVPNAKNPRQIPESAVTKLVDVITAIGWTVPIIASKDTNIILAGHVRRLAAQKLGLTEVPVLFVDVTQAEEVLLLISDNRIQDETEWEYQNLRGLLEEFKAMDSDLSLTLTGFSLPEIENLQYVFSPDLSFQPSDSANIPALEAEAALEQGVVSGKRQFITFYFDLGQEEDYERVRAFFHKAGKHETDMDTTILLGMLTTEEE